MGNHAAAPLGHAVDLALFHIITGQHKGFGKDFRGQQDSLPSNSNQQDIGNVTFHLALPIASNLHSWRQTSQPVQSRGLIYDLPFLPSPGHHSMAGQPI
jgi:hypothetical protein